MTNREYLEANKIAFDKAMGDFNKSGLESFDEWLNKERIEWKFKVGDFLKTKHNYGVIVVIDFDDKYMYYKVLLRDGTFDHYEVSVINDRKYLDDHTIFVCRKNGQNNLEKIF